MIGRQAYKNPQLLLDVDEKIFATNMGQSRIGKGIRLRNALIRMLEYVDWHLSVGGNASNVLRHLINSVSGMPGAKAFRSTISNGIEGSMPGPELLDQAMSHVDFWENQETLHD